MRQNRSSLVAGTLLVATLLAACGDDDDTTDAPTEQGAETTTPETSQDAAVPAGEPGVVTIERSRFDPDELTVAVGDQVTWENLDPFAHTVTSAEASAVEFDSGDLAEGDTFAHTFDEPGTYDYFCEIHPTMKSSVVVG